MTKPLRLLPVITDSGIGGTEKVLSLLLKNLPRDRFEPVGVVVLKNRREMAADWEAAGVPVTTLGMGRWPLPWQVSRLRSAIVKAKPDLVHAFLYHAIQMTRWVHRGRADFRLITSPRVNYQFAPKAALKIDRWLRREDTLALCESEAGKKSLVTGLGYEESKVRVAWTSVDRKKFSFNASARTRLRSEWGMDSEKIVIGSVGRLHSQKGYDLLIAALAQMKDYAPRYQLVIAGTGPERESLEVKASAAGVPVLFLGERSDVPDLLSAFDVYVQSSRYEGLSNALLEAMSVGLPCAATAVDGTLDFAQDGKNLVLTRPGDPASLAVALATLIEKPALRGVLSENAKITASNFSLERMIQGFTDAYEFASRVS